jgi:trk system potassium uptake protein TrkH
MKGKVLTSLFASVTPRTAGFNTVDTTKMTQASKLLTIFLMYVGASPGSTGGGIKTSTFAVVLMTVISVIKGRQDTEIMGRRIAKDIIYKAIAVVFLSMGLIAMDVFILSITEKGAQFIEMLYEATSAFGTVGLSLNFSPRLTSIGRVIIILTMYAGRVGPLSLVVALLNKQLKNNSPVKYPEDKVLIG